MSDLSAPYRRLLLLALALTLILRGLLLLAHGALDGDEFDYVRQAQTLAGDAPGGMRLEDPVLLPSLLAAWHKVWPDWESGGRVLSLILAMAGLLVTFQAGRSMVGPRAAAG
ncbi:MAG: hypothetical protein ACYCW6_30735, partial [Candidatus Xenobia bacterium]